MMQPVIEFGTSIHGKSMSGGVLNGCQKLLAFAHSFSIPREKLELVSGKWLMFTTDSNKRAPSLPCGTGHSDSSALAQNRMLLIAGRRTRDPF
jgi:hypothetical protein